MALPSTSRDALEGSGFQIVEERPPSFLFDRSLLVTGEVDRTTDFERVFPWKARRARRLGRVAEPCVVPAGAARSVLGTDFGWMTVLGDFEDLVEFELVAGRLREIEPDRHDTVLARGALAFGGG